MKHNFSIDGFSYRLRPVRLKDAEFIVKVRLEDAERNRYIHPISSDPKEQEDWLKQYFERENDFYFVVENRFTREPEGLIAFYNQEGRKAEWGRWVMRKGSLAAAESVDLLYRIAFGKAGLDELYCRTVAENKPVISFHSAIGEKTRGVRKDEFEIGGKCLDAVEQYADRETFWQEIHPGLERKALAIFRRNLKKELGGLIFHHIGVACHSIEKEKAVYFLLGYTPEGESFEDLDQGIRGQFVIAKDQPRLELLENLEGNTTLTSYLETNTKFYHLAYYVTDFEKAIKILKNYRACLVSEPKVSIYFGKRICFFALPNMQLVELLEQ